MRSMTEIKTDLDSDLDIAVDFITDIIEGMQTRFNISFNDVDNILSITGYWDVLSNIELACIGAHDDLDVTIKRIQERANEILPRDRQII